LSLPCLALRVLRSTHCYSGNREAPLMNEYLLPVGRGAPPSSPASEHCSDGNCASAPRSEQYRTRQTQHGGFAYSVFHEWPPERARLQSCRKVQESGGVLQAAEKRFWQGAMYQGASSFAPKQAPNNHVGPLRDPSIARSPFSASSLTPEGFRFASQAIYETPSGSLPGSIPQVAP